MVRSFVRFAVLAVLAPLAASMVFALGESIHPKNPDVGLSAMVAIKHRLQLMETMKESPDTYTVGFMGDSTVVSYPDGRTVEARLDQVLASQWPGPGRVRVGSLSGMGMVPAGFYLIQDLIVEADPDIVIVTAYLPMIREQLPVILRRSELGGWTRANRWFDALVRLDLTKFGVTADALLLHRAIVAGGRFETWIGQRRSQARLGYLRETIEADVANRTGSRIEVNARNTRNLLAQVALNDPDTPNRRRPENARNYVAGFMNGLEEDQWVVSVLRTVLEDFRAAGTAAVLYVPPINVERLQAIGVYDEAGVRRALSTLEKIAADTGAEFADLHDLLPDAAFRDGGGHYTHAPPYDGPALVAKALAPYVQLQARYIDQGH